jgi:hypothetical protein
MKTMVSAAVALAVLAGVAVTAMAQTSRTRREATIGSSRRIGCHSLPQGTAEARPAAGFPLF